MRGWLAVALGAIACAVPAVATADTPLGDPSSNREANPATFGACGNPNGASCLALATADIDDARSQEGVGPISLPTTWTSLSVPIQLMVIANLERIDRGLVPATGLSSTLNGFAQQGANADADPPFPNPFPGTFGTGNWAGGYSSPLQADFGWMYDDGVGSPNIDCQTASDPGCWGHRHSVLLEQQGAAPPPPPPVTSVVMGAAVATNTPSSPSMTQQFIANDSTDTADVLPLWATIASSLPVGVSATSLTVPGGSSKPLTIWASGENMNVTASISSGWTVAPAGCNLVAGHSCTLTVSAGTGAGTGTLMLTGPNGNQTVALSSQTATSLSLTTSHRTIVAGKRVTLLGKLTTAAGTGVGGQSVVLTAHPTGAPSTTVTGHTSSNGSVSFKVSPKVNTSYTLAFAGTADLIASASSTRTVRVAPNISVTAGFGDRRGVRFTVHISPSSPGEKVRLQRRSGRKWKTVKTVKLSRSGRFSFFADQAGGRYRVLVPSTSRNAGDRSKGFGPGK